MLKTFFFSLFCLCASALIAQENYEIQVYASPTMDKGVTMFELHSNYTSSGSKVISAVGELPTNHVVHETVEITHGWNSWFETGVYFFNSLGSNGRTAYVGSHIRPRVAIPQSWKWPVGLSLSAEFGFQKAAFDPNTSTLEIRPIIDKQWDKFYISLNPTVEKSFKGPDANIGFSFAPNVKTSLTVSKVVALGIEYYGSTGRFFHYDSWRDQDHQLFLATDLDLSKQWEFNAGIGHGFTQEADKAIFKLILGRRF